MNELPWRCRKCHADQMVDMDSLERWPLDQLLAARGFTCRNCRSREAISYSTPLLDEALKRLTQMRPAHRKFPYYFGKALRRAESINRRTHGALEHKDMAAAG